MEMFLNIVAEFKLFIAGGGSNQNLFSFLEGKTDRQVEIGEALLLNHERDKNAYEIEEIKIYQLKLYQERYEKSKNLFDFSFYSKKKHDFDRYQSCMYDRRLINITFEKFFWESGMN